VKAKEEAQVLSDVFQDAGWRTTAVSYHEGHKEYWFNAIDPEETGATITIWVRPSVGEIALDGYYGPTRARARKVLTASGLGAHLKIEW
jgi:hypothetical protein